MSEGDNKGPTVPITGLILIFAALSVILFSQAPFQSTRPASPTVPELQLQVEARLWEDPFLVLTLSALYVWSCAVVLRRSAERALRAIRAGAFAPFTQNPVVQALLVPFGGMGGGWAIDMLGKLDI